MKLTNTKGRTGKMAKFWLKSGVDEKGNAALL
jgi:hypothetical protein